MLHPYGTSYVKCLLGSLPLQMVDRLVVKLQDLISDLRLSNGTDVKNEIKTAKNYIQDADKLKQVHKMLITCNNTDGWT